MRLLPLPASLALCLLACGSEERPPRFQDAPDEAKVPRPGSHGGVSGAGGSGDGITLTPPPPDPATSCGFDTFLAVRDVPKLYVVLDRSGSMADEVGNKQKYAATRSAIVRLYRDISWKVDIGAALFPDRSGSGTGCGAGREAFALGKGDPKEIPGVTPQGPRSIALANALSTTPSGGTPTTATLQKLTPDLVKLGRKTFVLLATDGGPNCNATASCGTSACIPNIEGAEGCTSAFNCCQPTPDYPGAGANCLDGTGAVAAVKKLADSGIKTLVVGIPGSGPYASVLDAMAEAGGAPRAGSPRYYAVNELDALASVLAQVTADVLVSCDLTLQKAAESPHLTNVFLDGKVLPQGEENGWTFVGDAAVRLHGDACKLLEDGGVTTIQVVVGCPTVEPG